MYEQKSKKINHFTHKIVGESGSRTSVNQYNTLGIFVSDVHGWTLHFWIRKSHLHVYVIDVLKKITKISTSCFYRAIVPARNKTNKQ